MPSQSALLAATLRGQLQSFHYIQHLFVRDIDCCLPENRVTHIGIEQAVVPTENSVLTESVDLNTAEL
jgi:hypothetical protein